MLRNIFFYPIICALIYNNIKHYMDNKRKIKELFESLEVINIRIENINKFINRKKVMFKIRKDNKDFHNLDIDENSYYSDDS